MEQDTKKKRKLWGLILWQILWSIIFALVGVHYALKFIDHQYKDFQAIGIAAFCFAVLLIPNSAWGGKKEDGLIERIKALRATYKDAGETDMNSGVEVKKTFWEGYRNLTKRRKIILTIGVIIFCSLPGVLIIESYKLGYDPDFYIGTIIVFIVTYIVAMIIFSKKAKENMDLLDDIYYRFSKGDVEEADRLKVDENLQGFVFTKEYLINWSGSLHIIELAKIKEIKYLKYFYVFMYGTRMVVKTTDGKKYRIYSCGPSFKDWMKVGLADKVKVGSDLSEIKENVVHHFN